MNEPKALLLLLRQPPYRSGQPLEALDIALVARAFELPVSVLFEGSGVWQLAQGQDGSALSTRTVGEALTTLSQYDVDAVYACAESLVTAGLSTADLVLPVKPLSRAEQRALIARHDVVVND